MLPNTLKIIVRRRRLGQLLLAFFLVVSNSNYISGLSSKIKSVADKVSSKNSASTANKGTSSIATTVDHNLFFPAIGLVKEGVLNSGGVGVDPCTTIDYVYRVTNQSTNGEVLEFIFLDDPALGIFNQDLSNNSGDVNGNNFLEIGEEWTFIASYNISSQDRVVGQVIANQATVTASPQGGGQPVMDSSHGSNPLDDGDTVTDISECQPRVSLLKTGFLDPAGFVPCTTIGYSFLVTNESLGPEEFQNIQINDPILGPGSINGPTFDSGGDSKLSPGETWEFTAFYTIQQDDLQQAEVRNQAEVEVEIDGTGDIITDFSHPSDSQSDDFTVTDIISCQSPELAVLLTGTTADSDNDNCDDVVVYTYEVNNKGNVNLDMISITDDLSTTPILANPNLDDLNNNNTLDAGEIWTYTSAHPITPENITNIILDNQASVTANIVGSGTPTSDLSHPTDDSSAGLTSVDVSGACDTFDAGISLILRSISLNCNGRTLEYEYEVTRAGSVNLENIQLTDNLGNVIVALPTGDDNNNDILEAGETWTFTSTAYNITQEELNLGAVTNQATVTAVVQNTFIPVTDDSHPNDSQDDDITITDLTSCQSPELAVLLTGSTDDSNNDNCDDVVVYTYEVINKGNVDLDTVGVSDILGNTIVLVTDPNTNGILDVGETQFYTSTHDITEDNITNMILNNQATVTANIVGTATSTSDLSHPTNDSLAGLTSVDVSAACDTFNAGIALTLSTSNAGACTGSLQYEYEVALNGSVNLVSIVLSDNLGNVIGGLSGDINSNDVLEVGETWTYIATHNITQDELNLGAVTNQATVTAVVQNTVIPVTDDSHPTDTQDNGVTVTDITSCQNPVVEMLLTAAQTVDTDSDTCPDVIDYTYTIRNSGNVDVNITSLVDNLNNVISLPNPNNADVDGDNQLDITEEWIYTARYDIIQTNIDNSPLDNQATLSSEIVGSLTQVPDELSHETDFTSAGLTSVDVSGTCADTAAIGLTKEDTNLIDDDGDGCNDAIQYTFRVSNEGNIDLNNIVLNDDLQQLGNNVPGPFSESISTDGILQVNEVWEYGGIYDLTEMDVIGVNVTGQAQVFADPAPGVTITDFSHPSDFNDDDDTITDVSGTCYNTVAVGLTKIDTDIIDSDLNGCDDQIEYTIIIHNLGGMDLNIMDLHDDQLNDITVGPFLESGNADGVLEIGETWQYDGIGIYNITNPDVAIGSVIGRAEVTAQPVGTAVSIMDESHPTDETDVGDTVVPIPGACADSPSIAVTRALQMVDTDMDGCNDQIDFTITVSNPGGLDLNNIIVNDDLFTLGLPAGDTNNDGRLSQGAGETWTYTGSYDISQTDIDGGDVFSRAVVNAQSVVGNFPVQDFSHPTDPADDADNEILFSGTCDDTVGISIIRNTVLEDSGDGDNCTDRIAITIEVTNTGNAPLENVVVNDDLLVNAPTLSSNGNGDTILDSGETWEYTDNYDLDQADIDGINVISGADVRAQHIGSTFQVVDDSHPISPMLDEDNDDNVSGACADIAAITLVRTPILSDTDTDNCPNIIDFTIVVTNSGQVNLDAVELIDDNLSSPVAGPDDESININGILEVNEVWTYTGSYDFSQDDIDNTPLISEAIVTAEPIGSSFEVSDSDQNNIDLAGACDTQSTPAIGLIKQISGFNSDSEGCLESIEYSYSLRNLGNEDISNIAISDAMLGATSLDIISGDEGSPNVLEVGETWVFESFVYFLTSGDVTTGEVVTQATVTGLSVDSSTQISDESDANNYVENNATRTPVIDSCPHADLANIGLIKTASLFDSDGDLCSDSIIYFFTVENLGNIALENILLEDFFLGITLTEPNSRNPNEDEILDVGEQWNYNLVRPIVQENIDRTFVENYARVTAYRTDLPDTFITDFSHQSTYTLDDPTRISVIGACINTSAGIGLVKTGVLHDSNEDGCLESIQYTYRVANLGNQPLTGLILRDDSFENPIEGPLSGDGNDNGILEANEEWTYTVVYGITQEDLNIGFIENQATITANVVEQENFIVNDISDSEFFTRDNLTRVSVIEACFGDTIGDSDFKIFTGITPNGDGVNDFFRIQGIENFPDNSLKIYNRWGVLVYEANQYGEDDNLFSGTSFGRATVVEDRALPTGTYFYILTFSLDNPGKESYSGYLYINRD